jgi:hypothetical protein
MFRMTEAVNNGTSKKERYNKTVAHQGAIGGLEEADRDEAAINHSPRRGCQDRHTSVFLRPINNKFSFSSPLFSNNNNQLMLITVIDFPMLASSYEQPPFELLW